MFSLLFKKPATFIANKGLINSAKSIQIVLQNGYKSSISLDKLYPKSNLNHIGKPDLSGIVGNQEKFTGYIPIEKLEISRQRSSKPGGQHVNKTDSSIEVRFHLESSDWIPKWVREKLLEKHANRLTKDGYMIVKSEKTRKAMLNQADCLEKIRALIFEASVVPRGLDAEELVKIETDKKIAEGRRLLVKQKRSEKKSYRKGNLYDCAGDGYMYR